MTQGNEGRATLLREVDGSVPPAAHGPEQECASRAGRPRRRRRCIAPAPTAPPAPPRPPGYGPLVTDSKKILSLPEGFTYRIVAEPGVSTLSDGGEPTPSDTDGTACFATPGGLTLVDNHEIGSDEPFRLPRRDDLTCDLPPPI